MGAIALLAVVVSTGSSPQVPSLVATEARPEDQLAAATNLLSQLEDRKAAEAAEAGMKLHPPDALAARLLMTLGLARFNLLDTEGARRAFRAAAIADPRLVPPEDANPRAVALFGEARAGANAVTATPSWRYVGIALAGVGVVALGSAVIFGMSSQLARGRAVADPSAESAQGQLTIARGRAIAANSLFVAGGVLAVGGGTVALWPFAGGAAVSWRTDW